MGFQDEASSQITRDEPRDLAALLAQAAVAAVANKKAQRDWPKLWPLVKDRREHAKITNNLGQCNFLNKPQPVHVYEPWIEITIEQNVRRFEIAMQKAAVVQARNDCGEAFSNPSQVNTTPVDRGGQSPSSRHFIGDDVRGHGPAEPAHFGHGQHSWCREASSLEMQAAIECAASARRTEEVFQAVSQAPVVHPPNDQRLRTWD
jgi:hypothetical protein